MNTYQDIQYFYPEIALCVTILALIIADLVTKKGSKPILPVISVLGLIVSVFYSVQLLEVSQRFAFGNMLVIDKFGIFFKIFFGFSTMVIVMLSYATYKRTGEYYTLLISSVFGMYLMASSVHIVMIILSLEIVGITCYVLAGYRKYEVRSVEASLKYMLYGAVSTGVMLYGFSLMYGMTNEANLYEMGKVLAASNPNNLVLLVSSIFILAGIGYKIAIVPFHFWCPDVYEGAPTPITTFFSVGPKVAGIALLARFLFAGLSVQNGSLESWTSLGGLDLPLLVGSLAALTMTLGNMAALAQTNLKRLLAYSSIAHAGYILMGFALFNGEGLKAVMLYSVVYMFMNYGAFAVIDAVSAKIKSENINHFAGIASKLPFYSFAMVVFLVSLTGLPPTAGFIGKFILFSAAVESKLYWLVIVAALNSVVSLYYYFRIAKAMYFRPLSPEVTFEQDGKLSIIHVGVITLMLIPTLYFGLFWSQLIDWTSISISFMM